jgi:hypothetical protein
MDCARSFRVAVVGFVVIIVIFFAFAVALVFLVGLLSKENVGGYRPIRRIAGSVPTSVLTAPLLSCGQR